MLNERLTMLRKARGFSQVELAIRLNVGRKAICKWEEGTNVPDSDMLTKIADVFDVPVSKLLGADLEDEEEVNIVVAQLSRINEQLVIMNRRSRRIWKTIGIIVAAYIAIIFLPTVWSIIFAGF